MIIRAELKCKQTGCEADPCAVDKVIELPSPRFRLFSRALLADYDFIAENKNAIRHDEDARHCLLILDAEGKDGFLVDPQGYNYARYSAFVPNARSLLTPDISANVTWGKRRAMEAGKVSIQYKKLYGYRKGEDGQPEIIPEQAEIVRWLYERYLTGASLRMIKDELEQQGVKCFEDSPEWTISRIRSILQNEKYCGDVLMQKTFRQDFINRKAIKNTGQLPMYLIENHHEGIVSREKYDAVQAEMARRNAAKSPSKNAVTGMASYASKYALSERLVCGECGTLYRRCTWTRNGEKRVVWRCVSRLDYGKKYCHNSPTLDEAPLQQAILAVLNTAMADKNSLIRQITVAMETELIPFPGGTMSLGDIECRLRVLEQQFQTLLEKATDDPAAYGGQFKEILDEQTFLKEKRSVILANNNEQAKANQRIMDAAQTLENASPYITEWDESAVRQLVETVKILSKDEVAVTLKGGIEICQKIMY